MVTLEEIARLSGTSRSTVSRVINQDPHVSPDTYAKVMEVVRRMNYQPNAAARSLAAGHSRILGLVIPTTVSSLFTDPYFPILIQGVSSACLAQDYSVMLWLADAEYERRTIRQVLYNGFIDGVVVSSMAVDDPVVEALVESSIPFVLVGRHPTNSRVNYVDVDNCRGAEEMVGHLFRAGYRRIATITGPYNAVSGLDRLEGYRAALRSRNLAIDEDLIVESDFSEMGGYRAMQRLLEVHPQAVFVASDSMAVGALRAVQDAGLRVPEDIAVVGFDDMPFAARTTPALTTIRQPIQKMGAMAAEMLIDLIMHPSEGGRRVILPTELVIRASCGSDLKR